MPVVAKPKNTHAPNDSTIYDGQATAHGSQEQYYRLKLQQKRMEMATSGLTEAEREVMTQPSDLDMLTAKILVKLKTFSDHDPYLNTLRAITGKESREDIAEDLATRHYNKHITDYYVGQVVDSDFTGGVVDGRNGVRQGLIARALGAPGRDGRRLAHPGVDAAPAAGLGAAAFAAFGFGL